MCEAGRFVADFQAGTSEAPNVPDVVAASLTLTVGGEWVVWAHKVARCAASGRFYPLAGGDAYPTDAVAKCRIGGRHPAPQPDCTCGFHALSRPLPPANGLMRAFRLAVVLSGRILAYEALLPTLPRRFWFPVGATTYGDESDQQSKPLLFRAERQLVVRVHTPAPPSPPPPPPDDPGGRLAALAGVHPRGAGPVRLRLPESPPEAVWIEDDPGYCRLVHAGAASVPTRSTPSGVPVPTAAAPATG